MCRSSLSCLVPRGPLRHLLRRAVSSTDNLGKKLPLRHDGLASSLCGTDLSSLLSSMFRTYPFLPRPTLSYSLNLYMGGRETKPHLYSSLPSLQKGQKKEEEKEPSERSPWTPTVAMAPRQEEGKRGTSGTGSGRYSLQYDTDGRRFHISHYVL